MTPAMSEKIQVKYKIEFHMYKYFSQITKYLIGTKIFRFYYHFRQFTNYLKNMLNQHIQYTCSISYMQPYAANMTVFWTFTVNTTAGSDQLLSAIGSGDGRVWWEKFK